jgi:hypothetical protein
VTKIQIDCPQCGNTCDTTIYQRITNGNLTWSAASICEQNHVVEMDGSGLLPLDLRASVLSMEGSYELILEKSDEAMRAFRKMRQTLNLPLSTRILLTKNASGRVVSGTKVEMDWLADILHQEGIAVSVERTHVSRAAAIPDLSEIVPAGSIGSRT